MPVEENEHVESWGTRGSLDAVDPDADSPRVATS